MSATSHCYCLQNFEIVGFKKNIIGLFSLNIVFEFPIVSDEEFYASFIDFVIGVYTDPEDKGNRSH